MNLATTLAACLSSENVERKAAEEAVKQACKSPEVLPPLMEQVCSNPDASIRQMGAVLLRKSIAALWPRTTEELQTTMKATLLQRMIADDSAPVRRALTEAIAKIAKTELPASKWPELLPFLLQCHQSPDAAHRVTAMQLFEGLTDSAPHSLRPHLESLRDVFARGLQDPDATVKRAALQAVKGLLGVAAVDDGADAGVGGEGCKALQGLIPGILTVMGDCLKEGLDDALLAGMDLLLDVIEDPSPILAGCVPQVVQFGMAGALNVELDMMLRDQCLQIIVNLTRFHPKQLVKSNTVPSIVAALCILTAEPDQEDADSDDITPNAMAGQALDQLALNLAAKHVCPATLDFAKQHISSPEVNSRVAAVTVVAVIAEGCCESMKKQLKSTLLPIVAAAAQDTDSKVRVKVAFAINQLASQLRPEVAEYHAELLPQVINLLITEPSKEGVECATAAVDALVEVMDEETIAPYVPAIVERLLSILRQAPNDMHDSALACMSSTASAAGEGFAPYAEAVLPLLRQYMTLATDEMLMARAAATECAGLVVETLGLEAGKQLLPEFLKAAIQGFELEYTELQEYGHGLFSCSARLLKTDFAPYLSAVVPLAFASIEQKDGVVEGERNQFLSDSDDDDSDDDSASLDKFEQMEVRTGVLDEKCAALQALGVFAEHTGHAFVPFLEKSIELANGMCEYFHVEVRKQAIDALPKFVCATHQVRPGADAGSLSPETSVVLEASLKTIFSRIKEDLDRPVVSSCLNAITLIAGPTGGLPAGSLTSAMPLICEAVTSVLSGTAECQGDKDPDEDDIDEDLENDQELIAYAAETLPALACSLGPEQFMQAFQQLLGAPFILRLQPTQPAAVRSAVLGTTSELMVLIGSRVAPYADAILPVILRELKDEHPENRHHAVYALGLLAEACSVQMAPQAAELLRSVHPLLQDGNPSVVDNACGAIARIATSCGGDLPIDELVRVLCSKLPLREDFEEAEPVYTSLAKLSNTGCPEGLEGVFIGAFGGVVVQDKVLESVKRIAAAAVVAMHGYGGERVSSAVAALPADQQAALQQLSVN